MLFVVLTYLFISWNKYIASQRPLSYIWFFPHSEVFSQDPEWPSVSCHFILLLRWQPHPQSRPIVLNRAGFLRFSQLPGMWPLPQAPMMNRVWVTFMMSSSRIKHETGLLLAVATLTHVTVEGPGHMRNWPFTLFFFCWATVYRFLGTAFQLRPLECSFAALYIVKHFRTLWTSNNCLHWDGYYSNRVSKLWNYGVPGLLIWLSI